MNQPEQTYDVVVIGAGSAGLTAAVGAAAVGRRTLLIEREHIGGECTNAGCIPSKALLHHAKTYHHAVTVAGETANSEMYRASAFQYVRSKIDAVLATESTEHLESLGITLCRGEAEFVAPCVLTVAGKRYRFRHAIIATGSRARTLTIRGLTPELTLTNENFFEQTELPPRLLIIGGGPIGLEMGQAAALLGSQVTIVTNEARFASREDEAVANVLAERFAALGITVLLNAEVTEVAGQTAKVSSGTDVDFDKVLVAVGRVPNFPAGLETAKIAYDERCILVDGQYRTSNRSVYAVGDVALPHKFTHTASDASRQVVAHIASRGWLRANRSKAVPKVTYTEPEAAQVGLTYEAALQKYSAEEIRRIEVPLTTLDRAVTDDASAGVLVVVVRRLSGIVLGAHLIGPRAGELITVFTLAIDRNVSLWALRRLIITYPTYSLIIQKAGDVFMREQLADFWPDIVRLCQRHLPKLAALVFWVGLIYLFERFRIQAGLSYGDTVLELITFLTTSFWGPLLYIGVYTLRPLILFPGTPLTILAGVLFGLWFGLVYTMIGATLSAMLAYWVGRFFGRGFRLEDTLIGSSVTWLRQRPFESVLFMRLFFLPYDLVNYGAGVLQVAWFPYLTATIIGIIPGVATFVVLGASIDLASFRANGLSTDIINPAFLALSFAIFIIAVGLSRFLRRFRAEE
jgi:pyruvate/2-oxoglutarate dehydrogenase complex dihydrolipoamide dehydrogenase (E3) component/uncharacterized membrane protein YdjX (TVP38/TMEM64 family)